MEKAQLTLDGKTIELPIVKGTEDEKAIDVTQLRSETKYITFDPSYGNTGSCSSDIPTSAERREYCDTEVIQ